MSDYQFIKGKLYENKKNNQLTIVLSRKDIKLHNLNDSFKDTKKSIKIFLKKEKQ